MSQRAARTVKGHNRAPLDAGPSLSNPLSPAEMAERVEAEFSHFVGRDAAPASAAPAPAPVGAADIVERAKSELARISGLEADHVSSVACEPDGWHVTVDLIELRRIPHSTDVLAAYRAIFATSGVLQSYQRTRRYLRDQMMEEA